MTIQQFYDIVYWATYLNFGCKYNVTAFVSIYTQAITIIDLNDRLTSATGHLMVNNLKTGLHMIFLIESHMTKNNHKPIGLEYNVGCIIYTDTRTGTQNF